MSNCDGAECTGSIRQFAVGAGGALTDTGVIASTGSHYDAVDMVVSQPGPNSYAYVLSNATGASTSAGALWQYGVGSTGDLTPVSPPMLNVGAVAVAQTMQAGLLYVLTANSGANADTGSTGATSTFTEWRMGQRPCLPPQKSVFPTRWPWASRPCCPLKGLMVEHTR